MEMFRPIQLRDSARLVSVGEREKTAHLIVLVSE